MNGTFNDDNDGVNNSNHGNIKKTLLTFIQHTENFMRIEIKL